MRIEHLSATMLLLATTASVQAVKVTSLPIATPVVRSTPDPVAASALQAAWYTFDVTVAAVIVATIAAVFALWALFVAILDARRNQEQLAILLRRPTVVLGLWTNAQGALGLPMHIGSNAAFATDKRYNLQVVAHNRGEIQADNFRLSVLVKQGSGVSLSVNDTMYTYLPKMQFGVGEVISISNDVIEKWDEVYFEGRTIQVTPSPLALCQLSMHTSPANCPVMTVVKLRLSCDGGNFFEAQQELTLT